MIEKDQDGSASYFIDSNQEETIGKRGSFFAKKIMGLICLIGVVLIWVASSELIQVCYLK